MWGRTGCGVGQGVWQVGLQERTCRPALSCLSLPSCPGLLLEEPWAGLPCRGPVCCGPGQSHRPPGSPLRRGILAPRSVPVRTVNLEGVVLLSRPQPSSSPSAPEEAESPISSSLEDGGSCEVVPQVSGASWIGLCDGRGRAWDRSLSCHMYREILFEPESDQELFLCDLAVFAPIWGTLLGLCASQPWRSHTQPRLWCPTLLALAVADPCPCPPGSHPQRVVGTATWGDGLCPWVPGRPRSLWFRGRNTSVLGSWKPSPGESASRTEFSSSKNGKTGR